MQWMYDNVAANYVLIIVLFTFALRALSLPLDIKQRKSSEKMAAASAELQKIQKRYASNPEIAQRKQAEYYKKAGISPYTSCLPMIITMLFFMVFFRGMNAWANINTINIVLEAEAGNYAALEAHKWLWVRNIWQPDSGIAPVVMTAEKFAAIPFDKLVHTAQPYFSQEVINHVKEIAANPDLYNSIMQPIADQFTGYSNGWFILPLLAGGSMIVQQLLTQKLNPQMAAAQGQGMSKGMMYGFAAFSAYICITSPTSFSLYWLASNLASMAFTLPPQYKKYRAEKKAKEERESVQ